jgi:hypothetical protein
MLSKLQKFSGIPSLSPAASSKSSKSLLNADDNVDDEVATAMHVMPSQLSSSLPVTSGADESSSSSSSTEVEAQDHEYEGVLGTSMMLSSYDISSSNDLIQRNALAEDFLCNISLTGRSPPSLRSDIHQSHFVDVSAQV